MPMCLTENSTFECPGSTVHVPEGMTGVLRVAISTPEVFAGGTRRKLLSASRGCRGAGSESNSSNVRRDVGCRRGPRDRCYVIWYIGPSPPSGGVRRPPLAVIAPHCTQLEGAMHVDRAVVVRVVGDLVDRGRAHPTSTPRRSRAARAAGCGCGRLVVARLRLPEQEDARELVERELAVGLRDSVAEVAHELDRRRRRGAARAAREAAARQGPSARRSRRPRRGPLSKACFMLRTPCRSVPISLSRDRGRRRPRTSGSRGRGPLQPPCRSCRRRACPSAARSGRPSASAR